MRFVVLLLSLLCGCQSPAPLIHNGKEGRPSKEYTVWITPKHLKLLQKGEAINLPLKFFDKDKGYRHNIGASVFARMSFGDIVIFLPASDPPYRTPEKPAPDSAWKVTVTPVTSREKRK